MGQLGYLLPALVFFGVFFSTGKDFLKATAAIMAVVTLQVIYEKFKQGNVVENIFKYYIPKDIHFNKEGNEILSDEIYKKLLKDNLL